MVLLAGVPWNKRSLCVNPVAVNLLSKIYFHSTSEQLKGVEMRKFWIPAVFVTFIFILGRYLGGVVRHHGTVLFSGTNLMVEYLRQERTEGFRVGQYECQHTELQWVLSVTVQRNVVWLCSAFTYCYQLLHSLSVSMSILNIIVTLLLLFFF